jgi:CheY-like chemotaxis protein
MPFDILNILQNLLLPLVLGALVVGGLLVYWVGRGQRKPAPRPQAVPKPPPQTRQPAPRPEHRADLADRPAATAPAVPAVQAMPAATDAPAAPVAPAAAPPALPLQADLLLVDDSAVVRAKLRRLFEPAGYRIALAQDGEAALALLGQGRYALLVTDLEMPRLDGVGLIRAALALPGCAGMPILAITGHEDLQSQLNQLQMVAGIYRKPWLDDELLGHVQALVTPALQPLEPELAKS